MSSEEPSAEERARMYAEIDACEVCTAYRLVLVDMREDKRDGIDDDYLRRSVEVNTLLSAHEYRKHPAYAAYLDLLTQARTERRTAGVES